MESLSSSELVETANEELQILQTLHPHRFEYLKLELESFIFLLREHHTPPPIAAVALTQVSSTVNSKHAKKIRKNIELLGNPTSSQKKKNKNKKNKKRMVTKRKDRVDIVLERARLCLQKIKDVKSSLF